jgi:arginine utilization regulatory protein
MQKQVMEEQTVVTQLKNMIHIYKEIIDSISDGIIASDHENKVIIYNKALAEMENHEQNEVLGKYLSNIYSEHSPESGMHIAVAKSKKKVPDIIIEYTTENGSAVQLMGSTIPVVKDGQLLAVFSVARNLNKTRQLLGKITNLHEQLLSASVSTRNNGTTFTLSDIAGNSQAIKQITNQARKAALTPFPVLLSGETGTGKELLAQGIHNAAPVNDKPFVAINCAAIPETLLESTLFGTVKGSFTGAQDLKGLFEQAEGGTLYLDEINSMPVNLQVKLLRVLQEKKIRRIGADRVIEINCRIISSTNLDPWECVQKGTLREDLLYRLMVILIQVPPLRERKEDIPGLAKIFAQKYASLYGINGINISASFFKPLSNYAWPGNVRELEHVVQSAITYLDNETTLEAKHIPVYLLNRVGTLSEAPIVESSTSLNDLLGRTEKKIIEASLEQNSWNISRAAKAIGIGRQNMQYRIKKLGIVKPNRL